MSVFERSFPVDERPVKTHRAEARGFQRKPNWNAVPAIAAAIAVLAPLAVAVMKQAARIFAY